MVAYERLSSQELLVRHLMSPQPEVIALSGGPCGGKTTLMERLQAMAALQDRQIILVPEVVTNLAEQGVDLAYLATNNREAYMDAQHYIIAEYVSAINKAKQELAGTNGLIVCDRGLRDNMAYVTPHEANELAAKYDKNVNDFGYDTFDKIVYLPSVAVGSPQKYKELKATNSARYEDAKGARATCERSMQQWQNHPEFHVAEHIDFETKMQIAANYCLGGENEFEQKWGANNEDIENWLIDASANGQLLNRIEIVQSYHNLNGVEFRLRLGQSMGADLANRNALHNTYKFAIKQKTETGNTELSRTITKAEYDELSKVDGSSFNKTRFVALHKNQVWHFDRMVDNTDKVFWVIENEVSHPNEFNSVDLPIPTMQKIEFNTKQFAKEQK